MRKISRSQEKALKNLANGRPSHYGLSGRSEMGGHTRTMWSLYRAGLVDDDHAITDAGRLAINPLTPGD